MTTALDKDLPKLGENVIYYPAGDVNGSPFVATVTEINTQGGLTLVIVPGRGGVLHGSAGCKQNIFRVGAEEYEGKPNVLRDKGAWDTLTEHDKRRREKLSRDREAAKARIEASQKRAVPIDPQSKVREQVMRLHSVGKKVEEIAKIAQIQPKEVESIIKAAVGAV